jgi:2-amino-4-hydroxy-6-hydroxymethyldihydropteridine diphosphokinase
MHKAWILLGGNEGDVVSTFNGAIAALVERAGHIVSRSTVYSSAAWNMENGGMFLNMALEIETVLPPLELLDVCKEIECDFGRSAATSTYRSRTLDIDIIFYDDIIYNNPRLFIPHPLAHIRKFVLNPLSTICPDKIHPLYGKTVSELLFP